MSAGVAPSLSLYHLPLQPAAAIPFHVAGAFSRPKAHELAVISGASTLQLYSPEDSTGALQLLSSVALFSEVLSVAAVRVPGAATDVLVLASDSGLLNLLAFDQRQRQFVVVQQQMMGKTGLRRGACGHYVAVEPRGRALMCAALERSKMAFILNREQQSQQSLSSSSPSAPSVRLSSPLEAHKSGVLTLSLCGVDVGFDNPMFAALEMEYAQQQQQQGEHVKNIAYYELDLGLNHVTRKHIERVDSAAHMLLAVPGPPDGPGGLLVLCESYVIYHPYDALFALPAASSTSPFPFLSSQSLRTYYPRRHGLDINPTLLVIATAHHVQKGLLFFLLQSEHGDLYKLTLTLSSSAVDDEQQQQQQRPTVRDVVVSYFDSITPSTGLSILRSGYLFCASESSSHSLFQITGLGERSDDDDFVYSDCSGVEEARAGQLIFFHSRSRCRNLQQVASIDSLHPILDLRLSDPQQLTAANIAVNDSTPVIYALCGKSSRSTLRFLRHGLALTEMALSELPATPTAVFTVRSDPASRHHDFIILSFATGTTVLSVGEQVSEVSDSGLLDGVCSLYVSSLSDGSLVQVHSGGLRHVRSDRRVNEWKPPGKKQIALAAGNERCVVCVLSGGELIYFEQDRNGALIDMYRKDLMNDVAAIAMAPVEPGKMRGRWLLVGGYDATVRVFSTDPTAPLQQTSILAVDGQVSALLVAHMSSDDVHDENLAAFTAASAAAASSPAASSSSSLYLYTGLTAGVQIRSRLDAATGALSDHRKRFLGARALQLQRVQVRGSTAVLALADRSWLDFSLSLSAATAASGHQLLPLSYDALDAAADFSSAQCPEGVVAIVGSTLRILALDGVDKGELFFSTSVPLRYTPRKMDIVPSSQYIAVVESDQNAYSKRERRELEKLMSATVDDPMVDTAQHTDTAAASADPSTADDGKEEKASAGGGDVLSGDEERSADALLGAPYAGEGRWASCISLHPPPFVPPHPPFVLELDDNEAAFSVAALQFDPALFGNDFYLAVGTAKDLVLQPRSLTCGFVHVYAIQPAAAAGGGGSGQQLRLVHKTQMSDVPLALAGFQRRLLVGVGRSVRVYEMGKRRLLKKSETKQLPVHVCSIDVVPHTDRIVVGDMAEGFAFLHFSPTTRTFTPFSDSSLPRFLTARCLLDADTVAGADKFGNVFVCRLPPQLQLIGRPSGSAAADVELLSTLSSRSGVSAQTVSAEHKLLDLASFHLDSIVTCMVKANFRSASAASQSVLLCGTVSGGLLLLLPLSSLDEVELLTHLEMHMRAALPSLTGRDHLAYRSAVLPVKAVIDGALVEQFARLPRDRRSSIANELVSTEADIRKKLQDIRMRVL